MSLPRDIRYRYVRGRAASRDHPSDGDERDSFGDSSPISGSQGYTDSADNSWDFVDYGREVAPDDSASRSRSKARVPKDRPAPEPTRPSHKQKPAKEVPPRALSKARSERPARERARTESYRERLPFGPAPSPPEDRRIAGWPAEIPTRRKTRPTSGSICESYFGHYPPHQIIPYDYQSDGYSDVNPFTPPMHRQHHPYPSHGHPGYHNHLMGPPSQPGYMGRDMMPYGPPTPYMNHFAPPYSRQPGVHQAYPMYVMPPPLSPPLQNEAISPAVSTSPAVVPRVDSEKEQLKRVLAELQREKKEREAKDAEARRVADIAAATKKAREEAEAEHAKMVKTAREAAEKRERDVIMAGERALRELNDKAEYEARELRSKADQELKKAREAEEAAKAEAKRYKPDDDMKKPPITFIHANGDKFRIPWHIGKTWSGMEKLVKQVSKYSKLDPEREMERYHFYGPEDDMIIKDTWEYMVQPGWVVTMRLTPDEAAKKERAKKEAETEKGRADEGGPAANMTPPVPPMHTAPPGKKTKRAQSSPVVMVSDGKARRGQSTAATVNGVEIVTIDTTGSKKKTKQAKSSGLSFGDWVRGNYR